jgi:hypothetical protein
MRKATALVLLAGAFATAACDSMGRAMTSHTDVLARAAGHELTVEEAATMIAPHPHAASADVVRAVASFWVDYILFATAASRDSTLGNLDLDATVKPFLDQEAVMALREKVIKVDSITEDQLRAEFEKQKPGQQTRARHILLKYPEGATQPQRDSVRRLANSLRDRARGREDFAALARSFSQDQGSAPGGGDVGFFSRGQMVPQFDSAAFALPVGQVSDPVETVYGLHIIKVEERKEPGFDDVKQMFRDSLMMGRMAVAESTYFTNLTAPLKITVEDGAVENAKELARKPGDNLRGRAANRALVKYEGGSLTAGEFLEVLRGAGDPSGFANAPDETVKGTLEGLTRQEILINKAKSEGFDASEARRDTARMMVRSRLQMVGQGTGLTSIQPQDGETMMQAIERRVNAFLEAILRQEAQAIPFGPLSFSLREQFRGEVFERAIQPTIAKIEEQRANAAQQPGQPGGPPGGGDAPPANTPRPTTGG